jgi:hypothetical protein
MQYLWTEELPEQPVPKLPLLTIKGATGQDNVRLTEGKLYQAQVTVESIGDDPLSYRWELMREVEKNLESDGGDFEPTPKVVWSQYGSETTDHVDFKAPSIGEYRLFIYLDDAFGGSATANIPVLVVSLTTAKNL